MSLVPSLQPGLPQVIPVQALGMAAAWEAAIFQDVLYLIPKCTRNPVRIQAAV